MPSARDWDQMLKTALDMKSMSQKFIDFAHMYGAGKGGEGEDDLEELPEDTQEDTGESPLRMMGEPNTESEDSEADAEEDKAEGKGSKKKGRNAKAAILIALMKKKGGRK